MVEVVFGTNGFAGFDVWYARCSGAVDGARSSPSFAWIAVVLNVRPSGARRIAEDGLEMRWIRRGADIVALVLWQDAGGAEERLGVIKRCQRLTS
jgi:hypothetical protein